MKKNILNEYTMLMMVNTYDVGEGDGMRLSAILRYQQEAADRHLSTGGLGWQALGEKGMAFVASRWRTVIHRLPRLDETILLTTWHREQKGPRFIRCYEWKTPAGEVLVEGVMVFALVSTEGHRLLRGEEFSRLVTMPSPEREVACPDPGRFSLPDMAPVGAYTVRRSAIDRNGHMNNTCYADLLTDFLPTAPTGQGPMEVEVYFAGESRLGDVLAMTAGTDEKGVFYVSGAHERGLTFTARLVWGDI